MTLTIVFDLDDTLYLERDYVLSGIRAVSAHLEQRHQVTGVAKIAERLWAKGERHRLFDAALSILGVEPEPQLIAELVARYREHEPSIHLATDAEWFLSHFRGCKLALITDGYQVSQRRKIAALELDRFPIDPIICTDEWGRDFWKPHLRAFALVQSATGAGPEELVYVADNPAKDFLTPRALGWRTVQIDRPGAVHDRTAPSPDHRPDLRITSLDALPGLLGTLSRPGLRAAG